MIPPNNEVTSIRNHFTQITYCNKNATILNKPSHKSFLKFQIITKHKNSKYKFYKRSSTFFSKKIFIVRFTFRLVLLINLLSNFNQWNSPPFYRKCFHLDISILLNLDFLNVFGSNSSPCKNFPSSTILTISFLNFL